MFICWISVLFLIELSEYVLESVQKSPFLIPSMYIVVVQWLNSVPTICGPMDCSMPGSSVLHCLSELAQIHVHWVSDAIYPSHSLQPPSPFAFHLSQHQGPFQGVSSSPSGGQNIGASASTSVLPMNILGWVPLGLTGLISLLSKRLSRIFSRATVWKHLFFGVQSSLQSKCHIHTWLLEKTIALTYGPLSAKWCLYFLICCVGLW